MSWAEYRCKYFLHRTTYITSNYQWVGTNALESSTIVYSCALISLDYHKPGNIYEFLMSVHWMESQYMYCDVSVDLMKDFAIIARKLLDISKPMCLAGLRFSRAAQKLNWGKEIWTILDYQCFLLHDIDAIHSETKWFFFFNSFFQAWSIQQNPFQFRRQTLA